jgi:hypothetical protein
MIENHAPPKDNLAGVIIGIIDVQLMLSLAICGQLGMEPRALVQVLESLINQQEAAGGEADYVSSRHFAAASLAATLTGLRLPPAGREAPPGHAVPFSIIAGGRSAEPADRPPGDANANAARGGGETIGQPPENST